MRQPRTGLLLSLLTITTLAVGAMGCSTVSRVVKGSGFQEPTVHYRSVALRALDARQLGLDFDFDLDNPNPVGCHLESVEYELALNGHPVASGQTRRPLSVAARGRSPITLPYSVVFADVAAFAASLATGGNVVHYRLDITFRIKSPVGIIRVPASVQGDLDIGDTPLNLGIPNPFGL